MWTAAGRCTSRAFEYLRSFGKTQRHTNTLNISSNSRSCSYRSAHEAGMVNKMVYRSSVFYRVQSKRESQLVTESASAAMALSATAAGRSPSRLATPNTHPSPVGWWRQVAVWAVAHTARVAVNNGGMCAAEPHWKTCSERSTLHVGPSVRKAVSHHLVGLGRRNYCKAVQQRCRNTVAHRTHTPPL